MMMTGRRSLATAFLERECSGHTAAPAIPVGVPQCMPFGAGLP